MSDATPYIVSVTNTGGGTTAQMSFAQRVNADTTTNLNNAASAPVPIDGALSTVGTDWAISGNGIQFTGTTGTWVRCSFNIHVGATFNRGNMVVRLAQNGTLFGPVAAHGYIRNANGHNEASYSINGFWIQLTQNDVITVESAQEAAGGTVSMQTAGTSVLLLEKIDNV